MYPIKESSWNGIILPQQSQNKVMISDCKHLSITPLANNHSFAIRYPLLIAQKTNVNSNGKLITEYYHKMQTQIQTIYQCHPNWQKLIANYQNTNELNNIYNQSYFNDIITHPNVQYSSNVHKLYFFLCLFYSVACFPHSKQK